MYLIGGCLDIGGLEAVNVNRYSSNGHFVPPEPIYSAEIAELLTKEIVRLVGGSKFRFKWSGSGIPHLLSNCCKILSACSDNSDKELCLSTFDG